MSDLFPSEPLMKLPDHVVARKQQLLDAPDEEMDVLRQAICPSRVSYGMSRGARRIAESVQKLTCDQMSAAQRNAVIKIAYRYRRQLSAPVRDLVTRGMRATLKGLRPS